MSFLNGLKDVIGELGVRKTLEALQEAIEGTRCATIGICHLNKKTDLAAVDRMLGSVAFVNFSRSALLVAKDQDNDGAVRLAHGKFNLSVKGPDLLFRPQHVGDDPTDQFVRIEWEQPDEDVDPDRLFDRKKPESEADRTARAWLVAYLEKFGETPSSVVIAAGEKEGFSAAAIDKARKREKRCKTRKGGFGRRVAVVGVLTPEGGQIAWRYDVPLREVNDYRNCEHNTVPLGEELRKTHESVLVSLRRRTPPRRGTPYTHVPLRKSVPLRPRPSLEGGHLAFLAPSKLQ